MQLLIQYLHAHLFQRRARGEQLRDDVGALSLLLDHAL
jgi:hypothetical protein